MLELQWLPRAGKEAGKKGNCPGDWQQDRIQALEAWGETSSKMTFAGEMAMWRRTNFCWLLPDDLGFSSSSAAQSLGNVGKSTYFCPVIVLLPLNPK